ncbi:histidine kinase [bacterium]|nr:histidine kinase [bacterium]
MPAFESHWYDVTNKKRLFWILQLVGWGSLILLGLRVVVPDTMVLMPVLLGRGVLGCLITSFLVRPLLRRLRRLNGRFLWGKAAVALVCAVLITKLDSELIHWLIRLLFGPDHQSVGLDRFLNSSGPIRFTAYGFWIILYFVLNDLIESNSARLRLERLKAGMIESELRLLRSQVNPHFLFNALNSIIAEAGRPERVTQITHGLADYLRFSLSQNLELQPLGEELVALEGYLQVEKIRFEERLEYSVVADAEVRRARVPGALVQPLLENAIKFGQRTSPRPLRITIHAQARPEGVVIEVTNSGKWVPEGGLDSTGIGLVNLRRRLQLVCGDGANVAHEVLEDRVIFRVVVPAASTSVHKPQLLPVPA